MFGCTWTKVAVQCISSIVLNVKELVGAFNQEKTLVRAFSVITNLQMALFQALVTVHDRVFGWVLFSEQYLVRIACSCHRHRHTKMSLEASDIKITKLVEATGCP